MRLLLIALLAVGLTACGSVRPHVYSAPEVPGVVMTSRDADGSEAAAAADEAPAATPEENRRGVGGHISADPVEIVDFVLGFLLIDIKDDDF
jgi:hypothetical protein